jgi:hypothetical protein
VKKKRMKTHREEIKADTKVILCKRKKLMKQKNRKGYFR